MVTVTGAVTGCVPGCDGSMTGYEANPSQGFANPKQPVTPVTPSGNGWATRHGFSAANDLVTGVTGCPYISALTRETTKTHLSLRSYKGKQPVTPDTKPRFEARNPRSNPVTGCRTNPSSTRHNPAQAQP